MSFMYPIWQRLFRKAWVLNLVLFVILGSLRAYGLLGPTSVRMMIMLNFFIMWFLPYIFLTKSGRQKIGLKKVEHPIWWLWAFLLGLVSALVVFAIGYVFYGNSRENWYVGILDSWAIDETIGWLLLSFMQNH